MGPVQVLVVGLDRPRFSGEVLAELTRLGKAGIVRLVDLFLVSRAEDGTFETLDPPDGVPADLGRVAAAVLGVPEDEANADAEPDVDARSGDVAAWSLADAVPPGSAAAVALIEQLSAELVARYWLDLFNAGRLRTVRGWLDEMGYEAIAAHAVAALTAGWVSGLLGEPEAMEHWLTTAELGGCDGPLPDGTASLESGVAMIRGLFGYSGLEARREYLVRALDLEGTASAWRPWLLWGLGHVALLSGDPMSARELFRDVLRVCRPATGSPDHDRPRRARTRRIESRRYRRGDDSRASR